MKTTVEIDDALIAEALAITGAKSKKDAVELGLKTLIRLKKQADAKDYFGTIQWEGHLDDMRTDPEVS